MKNEIKYQVTFADRSNTPGRETDESFSLCLTRIRTPVLSHSLNYCIIGGILYLIEKLPKDIKCLDGSLVKNYHRIYHIRVFKIILREMKLLSYIYVYK